MHNEGQSQRAIAGNHQFNARNLGERNLTKPSFTDTAAQVNRLLEWKELQSVFDNLDELQ